MWCHHGRRGWNTESWHKLKTLESSEAENGASKGPGETSATEVRGEVVVYTRRGDGRASSSGHMLAQSRQSVNAIGLRHGVCVDRLAVGNIFGYTRASLGVLRVRKRATPS